MGHFHYCELCDEDVIYCDLPHCEYQDDLRDEAVREHFVEAHPEKVVVQIPVPEIPGQKDMLKMMDSVFEWIFGRVPS